MNPLNWSPRRLIAVRAMLTFWLAAMLPPAFAGTSAVVTPDNWDLYRGTRAITRDLATESACVDAAKSSGIGKYTCRTQTGVAVTFVPDPPTCTTPQPPAESRTNACMAPAVGSWPQTRGYVAAAYPTCWAPSDWSPASAPAGACVVPPPPTTDADAVWKAISTADGVSAAYGFDTQAEFTRGYQPGANGVRGFWDTNVKHSGAGAIRLEARAGETGANISGQWGLPSNTLGKGYGSNSEMWLHFAYMADAGFVSNRSQWNSNAKIISIYAGSVPCQALELTLVWPIVGTTLYTQCGNNLSTAINSPKGQSNTPPYLYQEGFDLAAGGSAREANGIQSAYPDPPAFQFRAGIWYRVLLHVKQVRLGSYGTWVEMWAQPDGGKWIKFVAWIGTLQSSGTGALDNLVLMNYMTGLSSKASKSGNVWYDELAVSEKPFPGMPAIVH